MVDYAVSVSVSEQPAMENTGTVGSIRLEFILQSVEEGGVHNSVQPVQPGTGTLPVFRAGAALQQRLVGVVLDAGVQRQAVLAVDELPQQLGQQGRFLDVVLGLAEGDSQGAGLAAQLLQGAAVVGL